MVSPYSAGTLTLQEAPSCAWRTNGFTISRKRRGHHQRLRKNRRAPFGGCIVVLAGLSERASIRKPREWRHLSIQLFAHERLNVVEECLLCILITGTAPIKPTTKTDGKVRRMPGIVPIKPDASPIKHTFPWILSDGNITDLVPVECCVARAFCRIVQVDGDEIVFGVE